jgi:hypothetical protein
MSFLYGNNVTKAGLARITDGTPQYGGVIVYSMSDIPLGFGIAAQPTEYCRDLEPNANVVSSLLFCKVVLRLFIYFFNRCCIKVISGSTCAWKMDYSKK